MIEVIVEREQDKTQEIKYPCYMESTIGSCIVLFSKRCAGTVEVCDNEEYPNNYKIGYWSDTWQMDNFKPFYGTITHFSKQGR